MQPTLIIIQGAANTTKEIQHCGLKTIILKVSLVGKGLYIQVYCDVPQTICLRIKNNPNNSSFSKTKWNFDANLGLIPISGPAHFRHQSLFYQSRKYKNWKSAFPGGLNKEKNKWVLFLLVYLSTTTRLVWILTVCNQSLMYHSNTAILAHSW